MTAVFRHELSSYFTGLTGYVFGGFLLLFGGIYTMVYNLNALVANYEYVMESIAFIFLIIVPILTMRILAEEKRQKTDQLLYSLPLTMTQVILGKFLALLVMFLLPLGILCLYPILLTAFGSVHLPAAFGSIFGFFLLGAALLSIGMFISSLTESQAVAAGLCFMVMLLNYFIVDLADFVSATAFGSLAAFLVVILVLALIVQAMTRSGLAAGAVGGILALGTLAAYLISSESFEGLFPKVMEQLSLFDRFYRFVDGVLDWTAVVYLFTVIGVFLFLSVQSMEKRRWSE